MQIKIKRSPTADSRTCDWTKVTAGELLRSSKLHIADVGAVMQELANKLQRAGKQHDSDKITDIEGFYANFRTGFAQRDWLDRHYAQNRHHLEEQVPPLVDLLDVLEYLVDCVVAGKARAGTIREIKLNPETLQKAFNNTVILLDLTVEVEE